MSFVYLGWHLHWNNGTKAMTLLRSAFNEKNRFNQDREIERDWKKRRRESERGRVMEGKRQR